MPRLRGASFVVQNMLCESWRSGAFRWFRFLLMRLEPDVFLPPYPKNSRRVDRVLHLFCERKAPRRPRPDDAVLETVPDRVAASHESGPRGGAQRHAVVLRQLTVRRTQPNPTPPCRANDGAAKARKARQGRKTETTDIIIAVGKVERTAVVAGGTRRALVCFSRSLRGIRNKGREDVDKSEDQGLKLHRTPI